MRLKEIEARLAEIKEELNTRAAELTDEEMTALEAEVTALQEERTTLQAAAEKRKNLLARIDNIHWKAFGFKICSRKCTCVLCQIAAESCEHLFFVCPCSALA